MQFLFGKTGLKGQTYATTDRHPGGSGPQVAEIVSFRLADDISDAAFIAAAKTTQPFLEETNGFIRRNLTKGEDGHWTDYIEWSDLATAKAAGAQIMIRPEVTPFLQAVAPDTVHLRYEQILWHLV